MVEREQGRGHPDQRAEVEAPVAPGEVTRVAGPVGGDEAKDRNAAFLEALDKVMADHHNVLAALAK